MDDVYKRKGYKDRKDYLEQLALEYGLCYEVVESIADALGPNEDFDGLVNALEDWSD